MYVPKVGTTRLEYLSERLFWRTGTDTPEAPRKQDLAIYYSKDLGDSEKIMHKIGQKHQH